MSAFDSPTLTRLASATSPANLSPATFLAPAASHVLEGTLVYMQVAA